MFLCVFQPQQGSSVTHPVSPQLYTHIYHSVTHGCCSCHSCVSLNCLSPCAIQGVSLSLLTQLRRTMSAKRSLCWVQSVPGFNFETKGRWGRDSGGIYKHKYAFHRVIRWTLNDSEVGELNRLRNSCSLLLLWEQLWVKGEKRREACLLPFACPGESFSK